MNAKNTSLLISIVSVLACAALLIFGSLTEPERLLVVTAFLALIGGNHAVAAFKSKGSGPKKPRGPTRARMMHLALLLPATVACIGCSTVPVGGSREDAGREYRAQGSATNYLTTETSEGDTAIQEYSSEPPAAVVVSESGVENYGAVPFGTLTAILPGGTRLIASVPNDFEASALQVTLPDGTKVDASGLAISSSTVVVARAQFVAILAPVLQSMTDGQRAAAIAELEAQAKLGDAVVQGALPILKALAGVP